ncbi:hypothetical protein GCM10022243_37370 [Saccharothrix violaceirubra]|uniref:Uncharacterized protein n=1 Tax=Saccharothrix violaceirubra TaxID=413306 RepID=A0A7W7WWU2_9PSEU|nr:hypothetical protein [Saccharothrix violaceirubra]MBB4966347.1 hypothetical protein [Saccharothrix violaceirubra]
MSHSTGVQSFSRPERFFPAGHTCAQYRVIGRFCECVHGHVLRLSTHRRKA